MAQGGDEAEIRSAMLADLEALTGIYNHYVVESHATFDLRPFTVAQRREWYDDHATHGRYRIVVAAQAGEVVGYASSSRFRAKPAYERPLHVEPSQDRGSEA
jgi:phosphinothricin acetyltransferase